MSKHTGKIERIVQACQGGAKPRDIAYAVGSSAQSVYEYLRVLVAQGRVRREGKTAFYVYFATGKPSARAALTPEERAANRRDAHKRQDEKRKEQRRALAAAKKDAAVPAPKPAVPPRAHMPKAQREAEAVITPQTKYVICPSGRDNRFEPDPSIAGRGAISADWNARRQQEAR